MPASITSSSGGSGSDSDSEHSLSSSSEKPIQSVKVAQNGSRKRRRLSPAVELDSESEAGLDQPPKVQPANPVLPASAVSRIKAKQSGLSSQPEDDIPASIREAIKGNEQTSFATIDVDSWLVASLANMAIKHPTGIQKGCIPEILKGRDCIGGSRTGSGKTVAFAIPILQKWAQDPVGIFAVVLTPTRYASSNTLLVEH